MLLSFGKLLAPPLRELRPAYSRISPVISERIPRRCGISSSIFFRHSARARVICSCVGVGCKAKRARNASNCPAGLFPPRDGTLEDIAEVEFSDIGEDCCDSVSSISLSLMFIFCFDVTSGNYRDSRSCEKSVGYRRFLRHSHGWMGLLSAHRPRLAALASACTA